MALILDHINGVPDDNRLENLRIVCPNCAATLDTHCGRKNKLEREPRSCLQCGKEFLPKYKSHRYCSQRCGVHSKGPRAPKPQDHELLRRRP
jgi:ribosomal protein S27AE